MIISGIKAYFKVAWAMRTPLVFLMNRSYKTILVITAESTYAKELKHIKYLKDFYDCSTYAWVMKALAHQDHINSFGFVIGWATWAKTLHAWNCFITPSGVYQLEPQNGIIGRRLPGYIPMGVIL